MNEDVRVSLKCDTESQKEQWKRAAEQQNRSLSNWIKTVCDKASEEQLIDADKKK